MFLAVPIANFDNTVSDEQHCVRIIDESLIWDDRGAESRVYMYYILYVCVSTCCLSVSGVCARAGIIHLSCYIYVHFGRHTITHLSTQCRV